MLDQSLPIGQIAATYSSALPTFIKYNINFCCHGYLPLSEVCQNAGISPDQIISEIESSSENQEKLLTFAEWEGKTSVELVDYIESHYHAALKELFPSTIELAKKVAKVHAGDPALAQDLLPMLVNMWDELKDHLQKEEQVLFPMLRNNMAGHAKIPARVMMMEHESHGNSIMELQKILKDYPLPADACGSWRLLYRSTEQLIVDLKEHIHLENNILFQELLSHSCCGTCG